MYEKKASVQGVLVPIMESYAIFCDSVHRSMFGRPLIITSIRDGRHGKNSLHYIGKAFDVRIYDKSKSQIIMFFNCLKRELDSRLDIVLEKDHIHIEYDPK